jgi:hypothetical protein
MPGRVTKEGKVIMTSKRLFGVLAVVALVALSATGAQAGPGGQPSPLMGFFVCRSINGDDAAKRVDVDSTDAGAGWGFTLSNIRIGNAILGCAFTKLFSPGGSTQHIDCIGPNNPQGCNEISPNPNTSFEQLKCYSVSVPRSETGTPSPSYTAVDNLFPGGMDDVTSGSVTLICAPASFTNPH